MKPSLRLLAIVGVVAALGLMWWVMAARRPEVRAVLPARGTAAEIVYATGAVEPLHWAKVASLIRDRIVEICECEGRTVEKGDVLARLDDREIRAALAELKAREDFARKESDRATQLADRGIATPQAQQKAAMELQQVQALITVQTEKLADYEIRAPMAGLVLRRDGQIGEIAEQGQILFRVGIPKPMVVVAEVNEEDIPRVALGQTVLFRTDAFKDRKLTGTVSEMTPMGDPVTKTYRIKIALPDDSPLRFGMSVEANIVSRQKADVLLVPTDAVLGNEVLVIDGGRVQRRKIVIGLRGTREVEVETGLDDKTRIASPAPDGLRDGQAVRVLLVPSVRIAPVTVAK